MRLSDAREGDVVRNSNNDNFYRFERPEADRARIRPLELFPNGLLIPKPMDTTVAADIVVELVGTWSEGMSMAGMRGRSRETYEKERIHLQAQLDVLEGEALTIEPKHRGSFANRLKAVTTRLTTLSKGLEDLGTDLGIQIEITKVNLPAFKLRQMVSLPSGLPARFLGFLPQHDHLLATVWCVIGGEQHLLQIDPEALRPYERRYLATV